MMTKRQKLIRRYVQESIGRELIGASNFASRASVVEKIINKFPTPASLSAELRKAASAPGIKPKASGLLIAKAEECARTSPADYPRFVSKLAGMNRLWAYVGGALGVAAVAAGAYWISKEFQKKNDEIEQTKTRARMALDAEKKIGL